MNIIKSSSKNHPCSGFLVNNTAITMSEPSSLIPKMQSFRLIFAQMRIKALSEFTSNLISDLESEGFTFRDFLLALADWSENQSNNWQSAAYYLEQAASPPPSQSRRESPSEQPKAE
ncbi:hypothetical protein FD723_18870 [Nostoc sp. C052]|uniref:hypothetical protein n=1 Tax=Nostoc sp. C052 TaxID=2576902 RepID=UPI0015C318DB|nr:hypothetical protein [Nostoc sp. C052]QLE42284.1 hypothetical protein FD723_18870 [Nostoc sp. C052]